MKVYKYIVFCLFLLSYCGYAQKDSIPDIQIKLINKYDPLAPSKAAFYSAILPGAGQVYNNRYWWQLPLMYGGMGLASYYYIINDKAYNKYRSAYKRRKASLPDQFNGKGDNPLISLSGLERAQLQTRKNREKSMLSFILAYALQVVEASVTAHLIQFDDDDNLSVIPVTIPENSNEAPRFGLAVKYSF